MYIYCHEYECVIFELERCYITVYGNIDYFSWLDASRLKHHKSVMLQYFRDDPDKGMGMRFVYFLFGTDIFYIYR